MTNEPSEGPITYYPFMVFDKPFCLWGKDASELGQKAYLESVGVDYYAYILNMLDSDKANSKIRNIIIRQTYHHALETLFSLIFSFLQSRHNMPAWIFHAQRGDLAKCVKAFQDKRDLPYSQINLAEPSWRGLCNILFHGMPTDFIDEHSTLLSDLAADFLEPALTAEYNAIKHGFRIMEGPSQLKVRMAEDDGTEEFMNLIDPDGGAMVLTVDPIEDFHGNKQRGHNFSFGLSFVGWDVKYTSKQIAAAGLLIENLKRVLPFFINKTPGTANILSLDLKVLSDKGDPSSHKARLKLNFGYKIQAPFSKAQLTEMLKMED